MENYVKFLIVYFTKKIIYHNYNGEVNFIHHTNNGGKVNSPLIYVYQQKKPIIFTPIM